MTEADRLDWASFVRLVAQATDTREELLAGGDVPIVQLPIDSLALAELVLVLILDLEMSALAEDLPARDWRGVTLRDVYTEYAGEHERRSRSAI
jgi:hypothetical protein